MQDRARYILSLLLAEGIKTIENSPDDPSVVCRIAVCRPIVNRLAKEYRAPGLTACVGLTFMKIAAGVELIQRFALEYFLQFGDASNVTLVFAAHRSSSPNHCFIILGPVTASDRLYVGRGSEPTTVAPEDAMVSLANFLSVQPAGTIVVDPLNDCIYEARGECTKLRAYCEPREITRVIALRQYPANVVGLAEKIKSDALIVAAAAQAEFVTEIAAAAASRRPKV